VSIRHRLPSFVLVGLTAVLLVAADEAAVTRERAKFAGEWDLVSAAFDGRKVPKAEVGEPSIEFEGTTYRQYLGKAVTEAGACAIDPTARPKALDFVITKGPDTGKRQLGLYKITGDTLTLCLAAPAATVRPRGFASTPGSGLALLVLERSDDE
jgi:uncharacterized protein (TIGR03067 family)